jgi:hypothetical protein
VDSALWLAEGEKVSTPLLNKSYSSVMRLLMRAHSDPTHRSVKGLLRPSELFRG